MKRRAAARYYNCTMSDDSRFAMPTAENNEVLRAIRDSDEVDYRIDPTLMIENLKKTPAERLRDASEAARRLHEFRALVRFRK
jgi:hypothetical protein